ncbi:MAG: hypothetical protein OEZ02_02250 [Anaerolineae bacterium]|nr:hypothetical protein [Anaerolineae bacterium]
MTLTEIHGRLANTAMLYFGLIALWGFWRFFRKQGVDSNYWGALVIAEVLLVGQVLLGTYLWFSGLRPERGFMHILYGIVSLSMIPGAFIYTKGEDDRPEVLVYGTATIIAVGLLFRAVYTGLGG